MLIFFPQPSSVNTDIPYRYFCYFYSLFSSGGKLPVFISTESSYNYLHFPQFLSLSTHDPYFSFGLKSTQLCTNCEQHSHDARFILTAPRPLSLLLPHDPNVLQQVRLESGTTPAPPGTEHQKHFAVFTGGKHKLHVQLKWLSCIAQLLVTPDPVRSPLCKNLIRCCHYTGRNKQR